ncbi:hypothetical protein ACJ41O_012232 [Fusarium nematophilum]
MFVTLPCLVSQSPNPSESSFLDLVESRLADVENDVRQLKAQLAAVTSQDGGVPASEPAPNVVNSVSVCSTTVQDETESGRSPDATDGVGTIEFTNEETWAYFGSSSNIAFTRIIRRTLGHLLQEMQGSLPPLQTSRQPIQGNALAVSRPQSPQRDMSISWKADRVADATCLPPEAEMSRLVWQFFRETGMLFPYINEQRFMATYRNLQASGHRSVRHSWLGLLNMILAMATSTETRSGLTMEQRHSRSEVFFNRAKALCLDQMMAGASVEAVQAMLLMTQYLQGTQRSIKTWAIHGLAVKAAFQLGLQSAQASQRFDALEREIRVRTWYGCVILDRTLSMTFGRPPSIPQSFVRSSLPNHLVESKQSPESIDWSCDENSTLFYNATITLYSINAAVIENLYGSNIGSVEVPSVVDTASAIFQIEQQLATWQASLPASLKLVERDHLLTVGEDTMAWKLRVILTLRYHNLRILSHRPILDRHLQMMDGTDHPRQESTTLQQIGQLSKVACLSSAQAVIGIVSTCTTIRGRDRPSVLLGAWWFTLYYTLVITAIVIIQHSEASSSDTATFERLDADLEEAVLTMARLDIQNRMLEKCIKFTATLRCLLQGLRSSTSVEPDAAAQRSMGNDQLCPELIHNEHGEDDVFASMMSSLLPEFHLDNLNIGPGDLFMSPGFIDNFDQGEPFW